MAAAIFVVVNGQTRVSFWQPPVTECLFGLMHKETTENKSFIWLTHSV